MISPRLQKTHIAKITPAAFSLIEVMLSLGIVSFALLALLGLLSSGLLVSKSARNEMLAAQISSSILAERRATPLATLTNNPLPRLDTPSGGLQTVTLDRSGKASTLDPYFTLLYEIVPSNTHMARVYMALAHPPQSGASFPVLVKAETRYETTTYVRLPDEQLSPTP